MLKEKLADQNNVMHAYNCQMFEGGLHKRCPNEAEFRDLSLGAKHYYAETFPKKLGSINLKERPYGTFRCSFDFGNGKYCSLVYGLRFQA